MPIDLQIIDIENQVKEIRETLKDLLEDIQVLGIHLEEQLAGSTPEVWQDYEDLAATRRLLAEKFEALRFELRKLLKF